MIRLKIVYEAYVWICEAGFFLYFIPIPFNIKIHYFEFTDARTMLVMMGLAIFVFSIDEPSFLYLCIVVFMYIP